MTPSSTSLLAKGLIYCVPKNVLAKIFRYISDVVRPDYSSEVTYLGCTLSRQFTSQFHLTHVCRRWRIEAINNPYFWNVIHVGSHTIDQTQTFLERSRHVPLDVEVSCDERNAADVKSQLELLTPHGHRIRYLLVRLECFTSLDIFSPLFKSLRDIVSLRIISFPIEAIMGDFSSPNPPNPLHYLRILQLCCVLPSARLRPYFANVTQLSMAWTNYGTHPTWREFASFINALHNLVSLQISSFEWDGTQLPLTREDIIVSPTLQTIDLSLTTNACILALNAFELSTVSHISIVCEGYYFGDPIILPYHLSETTTCTNLSISSTANSITFIATVDSDITGAEQQFNITLSLHNIKGTLKRSWIDKIIASWLESEPFKSSHSVLKSLNHSTNVGSDDDIVLISLPRAVTSTEEE